MNVKQNVTNQLMQLLAKRAEVDEGIARGRAVLEGIQAAEREAAEAAKAAERKAEQEKLDAKLEAELEAELRENAKLMAAEAAEQAPTAPSKA